MDSDSDDSNQMDVSDEEVDEINRTGTNFTAGKIVKIHLKNFLTHTEATVYPSEQLNLVIGPNGTGKSSIVTAIIIGMGGSTKIVSERNKLCDYVKNGKDVAQVTVTVYKDEQRNEQIFCREFNRQNKSKYNIDGQTVTKDGYEKAISKLNIQVGNLCQFLPQERVQDFAKQNPQELFASTQQSICSDEMSKQFGKLKDLREMQLHGNKELEKTRDLLRENENRIELMQETVENIRRKDELVNKKNIIEKKLAWMDFEELYLKCKEVDKDLTKIQKEFDDEVNKRDDLKKHVSEKTKERQKYEKAQTVELTKKKKHCDELNRISGEIAQLEGELRTAKVDLNAAIQNEKERQATIDSSRLVLHAYQQECNIYLETIGSVEQVQNQIKEIEAKVKGHRDNIKLLSESRAKLNFQIENVINPRIVAIDQKIDAMNSVANAKLRFLEDRFPDIHTAVMWLRNNQSQFRGRIYEPMIIEINVRSKEYSKFIENTVKFQDMLAFTCEEAEDMNQFLKIMRVDMKLKDINAVHSAADTMLRYKSTMPINEVRKYGGEIYLIDCFDAAIPIRNYLCRNYNVQNVLIGNQNLERKAEMLPQHMAVFFTPTHRVQMKLSKYSGHRSLASTQIKSKNLLNTNMDPNELNRLQNEKKKFIGSRDQVRNQRTGIEEKISALEAYCKTSFQEKSEHQKRIFELDKMRKKVQQQESKLLRMENEPVNLDGEKEKFNECAKEIAKKMLKCNENAIKAYGELMTVELNEVKARARLNIFKNGTANFDAQLMECNDKINTLQSYCNKIGAILDKTKAETKEKQVIALKLTENRKPSEGNKFPYKKDFDALPNERKELEEERDDLEQQLSCRSTNDQSVLDEYNERKKTIESLKKDLKKVNKTSTDIEIEINDLHNKWFPQIQRIEQSINRNFSSFMESMSCAGEVALVYPSERDYDQYGIEIRVKYRANEKLQKLDRFIQSGGERAVAISVYSLSLQHLSQVPFRCVDEINQGMDPNNERRVFDMLVNNVAQPGQSQFFYVTPKLQEKLPYNDHVTCLTVFNGPYTNHNDFFEYT